MRASFPFITNFIVHWIACGTFLLCDLYLDPKYRVPGKIDWTLYKKSIKHVLISQIIITPIVLYLLIPVWKWRGISMDYNNLFT